MSMAQVNLQHVFLIGPLLFYMGAQKENTPQWAFVALAAFTAMIPFIVTYNYSSLSYRSITNAVHYLVWIPLFMYIAWRGFNNLLAPWAYPMLQLLGLSAITIHLFLWAQKMNYIQ
jgi:hypothetical protein